MLRAAGIGAEEDKRQQKNRKNGKRGCAVKFLQRILYEEIYGIFKKQKIVCRG